MAEVSLDALVDSYCDLDQRPETQHQLSEIIDRLLYMHRVGVQSVTRTVKVGTLHLPPSALCA